MVGRMKTQYKFNLTLTENEYGLWRASLPEGGEDGVMSEWSQTSAEAEREARQRWTAIWGDQEGLYFTVCPWRFAR